jgi:hypothetical protein
MHPMDMILQNSRSIARSADRLRAAIAAQETVAPYLIGLVVKISDWERIMAKRVQVRI